MQQRNQLRCGMNGPLMLMQVYTAKYLLNAFDATYMTYEVCMWINVGLSLCGCWILVLKVKLYRNSSPQYKEHNCIWIQINLRTISIVRQIHFCIVGMYFGTIFFPVLKPRIEVLITILPVTVLYQTHPQLKLPNLQILP